MSIWTHVAGVIRFDSLRDLMPGRMWTPNLGTPAYYEDEGLNLVGDWDKCDVPHGSEGSLRWQIWDNPSKNSMASHTVSIWGDLRDYENVQEVVDYFNRITKGQHVRQACFTVEVEYREPRTFVYVGDSNIGITDGKFMEVK